jgi:hypothetical protein
MTSSPPDSLPPSWRKTEVIAKIAEALLIPVVILVAGHWFTVQQADAADARRNSDRVAELLSHLASTHPQERILAIQALRFHQDAHDLPDEIVASLVTVAATDDAQVGAAAVAALGTARQTKIEQQRLVLQLLGPMVIHLDHTNGAFEVWQADNTVVVTEVIRNGNAAVQKLLVEKAHLIPLDLVSDAAKLLDHYRHWFIEYERVQKAKDTPYVFVGPKGHAFPAEAEQRFRQRYQELVGSAGTTLRGATPERVSGR